MMKLAGHSSVTISRRYVHPTGEMAQLVFDRLETPTGVRGKRPAGKVAAFF
jgi:hypothetical protein